MVWGGWADIRQIIAIDAGFFVSRQLVSGNWQAAPFKGQFFLRGTNLTDALAMNAASAATVRGLSPLGGRALQAGLRVNL